VTQRGASPAARYPYEALGVRPLINANATLTRLGGSLMPAPVLDAMRAAAGAFVDLHQLQAAVSARIAALTQNEAALVSAGASAGLFLSALGCMTGGDLTAVARVMELGAAALPRHELVVQCAQRNPYDPVLRLAGARLVQVGNVMQTFPWELEAAIGERTAAVCFFAGAHLAKGALPLPDVLRIAHAAGVPVVVDAAGQLPPPENLWRFTQLGADLVVFSGGKGLRGPQASGLVLGRRELVAACALHASPHQRLGRPMKVGKEELMGLLAAVEWYLAQDHAAIARGIEQVTEQWITALNRLPGVAARRDFPGEAGQPQPRAAVSFAARLRLDGESVRARLLAGDPPIDVAVGGPRSIYLSAELLQPGEAELVTRRLREVVQDVVQGVGAANGRQEAHEEEATC
jgi:L-seryl-tRNA(Ser) seleniumtransferase